jgi:hypothetical protein
MNVDATPKILLVYGLSATGKTRLGKYLEKEKGWLFIEVDIPRGDGWDGIDVNGLRECWNQFSATGDCSPLVSELSARARKAKAPGVVLCFPSRRELEKKHRAALKGKVALIYLVGKQEYCLREFLAREEREPRGLAPDHRRVNNSGIGEQLKDPELKEYQIDVFNSDGTRIPIESVWQRVEPHLT